MAYEVEPPKYVRLAQTIQRRIEDGTYPPGTRVPSENQLVQSFGMSRPTVVRALELLKYVKEDNTGDMPRRLCTPTGLPGVG